MLICSKCNEEKPDIEFTEANGRGRGPNGRYKWCRLCRAKTLPRLNALKSRIRKNQKAAPIAKLHAKEMDEVYLARENISNLTGIQHHVEHVVPLSGENADRPICGLHVPWNVSLASAALNMSKGAKFTDKDAKRVERDHLAWLKARGLAILVVALMPFGVLAAEPTILEGQVTKVRDGDTIEVGRIPIRLNGVSAPELREPLGPQSKVFMVDLVMGKRVRCELNGEKTHDRFVGICYLNGKDIGSLVIRAGLALDCPRYSGGRYKQDQAEGAAARIKLPGYCR